MKSLYIYSKSGEYNKSVIQKLWDAEENKDLNKFNEVISEDFLWVKHSTGEQIGREVLANWSMSDESPKSENNRIIYENDEIAYGS